MKLLKRLLRNRKGISMTEVVVAMAMVVVVTGAAISVVAASVKFDAKYQDQTQALKSCENAVECVRFAQGKEELKEVLNRVGFGEPREEGNSCIFTLVSGKATVEVVHTAEDDAERYVVKYNDEVIYETKKSGN